MSLSSPTLASNGLHQPTREYAACRTLKEAIDVYARLRDLSPDTSSWYRRIVSTFSQWAGGQVPLAEFTADAITSFLHDKQLDGRSTHYVRSARTGLVAIARDVWGDRFTGRVRTIRPKPLDPEAWTPAEVARLIAACDVIEPAWRTRMQVLIRFCYHSGMDGCDVFRVEQDDILED